MTDLLKKAVFLGVGATIASKEKIQQMVDEFVVRGELGQSESKLLVESLVAKGEEQRSQIKQLVQEQVTKILNELNIATKQDLQLLENRLAASMARGVPGGSTDPQASTGAPTAATAAAAMAAGAASTPLYEPVPSSGSAADDSWKAAAVSVGTPTAASSAHDPQSTSSGTSSVNSQQNTSTPPASLGTPTVKSFLSAPNASTDD
ncbi:phasin family protein [Paenibacillus xerothermodurans]|uniref:phasin family protein n=1 Tax=Paenibacillus xerothermodurans TaxID=1977292 RepID=UPI001A9E8987|nr:hypothetical protein [Paenibacillus xerothermodurans]